MAEVDRVEVKVTPDLDGFRAKVHAELSKIRDLKVGIDPDTSGFRQKVQAELAGMRASVALDVDRDRMRVAQAMMQAQASANPIHQPVELDVDSDRFRRSMSSLSSIAGSALRFTSTTAGVAGIGVAASTAATGLGAMLVQAVPLAAALVQASGAALLLPAALGGAAAAAGTLAVGMHGVMDAFKNSGDPEKYAEALEKLTPAARDFVEAGVGLKEVFTEIREVVQENLFAGLGDELRSWQTNLLPALKSGMAGIADGLNDVMSSLMQTLGSPKVAAALETLFGNTSKGLSAAAPGFASITEGLISLAAGGSAFFERLGVGFSDAGEKFSRWVEKISSNGDLDRWINNGIEAFKGLGRILGDLGSGLASIFRAADAAGMDFIGSFGGITGAFSDWAKSDQGQADLTAFFREVRRVTDALVPVGTELFSLAGHVASGVADIATAFAPFATTVLQNLQPVVDTLAGILEDIAPPFGRVLDSISKSLGPAFESFGEGVKDVFEALADASPEIGSILESVGKIGGAVLSGIADVLPTIATALDSLAGFLADVVEAIGPVPAAILAFTAALAVKGLGGGVGGGKGFGRIKGAIVTGGVLAMLDVAMEDFPKTGKEMGLNFAQGVAGGIATGFAVGGPVGAAIGGVVGAAAAFHPVFMEAGRVAATTFARGFMDAQTKEGDKWLDPFASGPLADPKSSLSEKLSDLLNPFDDFVIHGKGTHVAGDPQMEARWAQTTEMSQKYYDLMDDLYINDYEMYKKYEGAKDGTKKDRIKAAIQIEKEMAAKQAEYAERGGNAAAEAIEKSAARRELAQKQASQKIKDALWMDGESMKRAMQSTADGTVEAFEYSADASTAAMRGASANISGIASGIGVSLGGAAKSGEESFKVAGAAMTSAMGTAAKSSSDGWFQSANSSSSAVSNAASGMANAFFATGNAGSYAANQSAGSWLGFGSTAGGTVDAFYRRFNNRIPQDASATQAAGAAGEWSGMGGTGASLGSAFGQGLAGGIRSKVGEVRAASAQLANAARDAAILAARIASPSKVAYGLGEHWGEGLARGIEAKVSRVGSAARGAISAANLDMGDVQTAPQTFTIVDSRGDLVMMGNLAAAGVTAAYDQRTADQARYERID